MKFIVTDQNKSHKLCCYYSDRDDYSLDIDEFILQMH